MTVAAMKSIVHIRIYNQALADDCFKLTKSYSSTNAIMQNLKTKSTEISTMQRQLVLYIAKFASRNRRIEVNVGLDRSRIAPMV